MKTPSGIYHAALGRARKLVDFEHSLLDAGMRDAVPYAFGELLDVGCGDKPYEALFKPHVTRYVGLEYDDTYCTDTPASANPKADVTYCGDRMPFEDESFDTVLCNQVGEHVPDPWAFFQELVRVVRPGGCIILTVPFSYRTHMEPHDYHRFTRYALMEYAKRASLVVERLAQRGGFWVVVGEKLMSHFALRYARMKGDIQSIGGLTYEAAAGRRPRYWTFPFVAPAIISVALAAKVLDRLDYDESDTLGYLLVARKPKS